MWIVVHQYDSARGEAGSCSHGPRVGSSLLLLERSCHTDIVKFKPQLRERSCIDSHHEF